MQMNEYLNNLLGKNEAEKLLDAIRTRKTVLIDGPEGPTGKTTLCHVLQKAGVPAIEKMDTYEVNVRKPLDVLTPTLEKTIIYGPSCGRDKNGVFRCTCGRCEASPYPSAERMISVRPTMKSKNVRKLRCQRLATVAWTATAIFGIILFWMQDQEFRISFLAIAQMAYVAHYFTREGKR